MNSGTDIKRGSARSLLNCASKIADTSTTAKKESYFACTCCVEWPSFNAVAFQFHRFADSFVFCSFEAFTPNIFNGWREKQNHSDEQIHFIQRRGKVLKRINISRSNINSPFVSMNQTFLALEKNKIKECRNVQNIVRVYASLISLAQEKRHDMNWNLKEW